MKKLVAEQTAKLKDGTLKNTVSKHCWFQKQKTGNACGTIAVLHLLANLVKTNRLDLPKNCFLEKFLDACEGVDPDKRASVFEDMPGLLEIHAKVADQGQTDTPAPDASVDHHFIAFVMVDGDLYEFDGCKICPINHGETTQDTFVSNCFDIMKTQYIEKLDKDSFFSAIAFSPNE
eukprot:CAMPEP_0201553672 /NCGR_PEP_ID=MMETSP0173_2-20130828/32131_1 /ASSEMBLY_ACC=CAM_ASM_000268 /TAXON_ID=218659 /ORGANISM="Vexillifera sp., Strain DIVA3 564/2" /LENGTH=175 /DNA_ID=CAMNT_0047964597 /DNA_START=274 /DNA_END=801 /DNA_ORIENTATION=+